MSARVGGSENRSPIKAIVQWWRDWTRTDSVFQLSCCGEPEVERIARDIRMTPSELRAVAIHGPRSADLLLHRMAVLNLDPAEVADAGPQTYRDLQRACTFCESKKQCERDLAREPASPAWKDYCPNTGTLMALDAVPWACRREW